VIVIDSSVVVSIVRQEDDADILKEIIDNQDRILMSAVSYAETNMVISGRRRDADLNRVDLLLAAMSIEVVAVSSAEGKVAVHGFLLFGKGRHRARLNLGDCFSYALAKSRNLPLLFKGDDFIHTDIVPAWRP
jgi:ribonuclease VapC